MKPTDYKAIRYIVFLLIIVVFSSNKVIGQYDYENGILYYNKGVEKFNKEEYKEADSLLKITLKYFPSCDAYYYLAKIRKCSNDKVEYCKYLDSSLIYGGPNVIDLYAKECLNRDTSHVDDEYDDKYYYEKMKQNNIYQIGETESPPEFTGGEDSLKKYLLHNIISLKVPKEYRIECKLYVSFVINKQGEIENIEINEGINHILNAEAIRIIKNMPKWKPGMQCGKPVKVAFTIPINFALN